MVKPSRLRRGAAAALLVLSGGVTGFHAPCIRSSLRSSGRTARVTAARAGALSNAKASTHSLQRRRPRQSTGPLWSTADGSLTSYPHTPSPSSTNRRRQWSPLLRVALSAASFLILTGVLSRVLPQSSLPWTPDSPLATALSPIVRARESLDSLASSSRVLKPLGVVLGWALDGFEVVLDAVRFVVGIILLPITWPLQFVWDLGCWLFGPIVRRIHPVEWLTSLLSTLRGLVTDGPKTVSDIAQGLSDALQRLTVLIPKVFEGIASYIYLASVFVTSSLANLWGTAVNGIAVLFNKPEFLTLDAMDPLRKIPPNPIFVPANGIKLQGDFNLKHMYGRRWKVHAKKWDWVVPFWQRMVMESQLVRYKVNWPKAAAKARFGFPEILRGPSPLLGGSILSLGAIYLIYRSHVKTAIWVRELQQSTYGKQTWNPVTKLEEDEDEKKKKKEGDDEEEE